MRCGSQERPKSPQTVTAQECPAAPCPSNAAPISCGRRRRPSASSAC
jgi:hypothetical protein